MLFVATRAASFVHREKLWTRTLHFYSRVYVIPDRIKEKSQAIGPHMKNVCAKELRWLKITTYRYLNCTFRYPFLRALKIKDVFVGITIHKRIQGYKGIAKKKSEKFYSKELIL